MKQLKKIAQAMSEVGGKCYLVGGYVRDFLMGRPSEDKDVEVYNLTPEQLEKTLALFGPVQKVGKSFGIYKVKGIDVDFALPRTEVKTGKGHRNFAVTVCPHISPQEAILRRDFTMNAVMMDVLTGEMLDFCGGQEDIKRGIIRHVNSTAFTEDPLRILRAIQFAGRFQFSVHSETIELMKAHLPELNFLPKERVYEELKKLLLKAEKPSIGLRLMKEIGVNSLLFPELDALMNCPQSAKYHPEGDVWEHTLLVVDEVAKLRFHAQYPESLMWAALCHDLGKPLTTEINGAKISSYGHQKVGVDVARAFLARLTDEKRLVERVALLVGEHMNPHALYREQASDAAVRRLVYRTGEAFADLLLLAQADSLGRAVDARQEVTDMMVWFRERINRLSLDKPIKPLVTGHHLIAMGLKPSPQFGVLLKQAMDMQLNGKTQDEIMTVLKQKL